MSLTGVVARYFDAWNDRDPDACGDCFAPDGVREWRILAPPHIRGEPFPRFGGPEEIAGRIGAFMESVPDLRLDVTCALRGQRRPRLDRVAPARHALGGPRRLAGAG